MDSAKIDYCDYEKHGEKCYTDAVERDNALGPPPGIERPDPSAVGGTETKKSSPAVAIVVVVVLAVAIGAGIIMYTKGGKSDSGSKVPS